MRESRGTIEKFDKKRWETGIAVAIVDALRDERLSYQTEIRLRNAKIREKTYQTVVQKL